MPVVGSPDLAVNNASNVAIPSPAAWCSHTTLSSLVPCRPLFWLPPRGLPTGLPTVSPDESGLWASPPFARAVLPLPALSPFFLAPDSCLSPRSVLDALRLPPPIQNNNNNNACGSILLSVFRFRVGLHSLPDPTPSEGQMALGLAAGSESDRKHCVTSWTWKGQLRFYAHSPRSGPRWPALSF